MNISEYVELIIMTCNFMRGRHGECVNFLYTSTVKRGI